MCKFMRLFIFNHTKNITESDICLFWKLFVVIIKFLINDKWRKSHDNLLCHKDGAQSPS